MNGRELRKLILLPVLFIALLGALLGAKDCDVSIDEPVTVHVIMDDAGNATVSIPPCPEASASTPIDSGEVSDAGTDAAMRCPIPPGRIVILGDSLVTDFWKVLTEQLGRPVESLAVGGTGGANLPDVTGAPAILIVGTDTNSLRYVQYVGPDAGQASIPEWSKAATVPEFVAKLQATIATWAARQRLAGHTVIPTLTVPRNDYAGNPAGYDEARRMLNDLRVDAGAESLAADPFFGDLANTSDLGCYSNDKIHMVIRCIVRRAQYALRALERCP